LRHVGFYLFIGGDKKLLSNLLGLRAIFGLAKLVKSRYYDGTLNGHERYVTICRIMLGRKRTQ
jgi:hypothetical protein